LLNKLAHRKYRAEFADALSVLRTAAKSMCAGAGFLSGLDAVEEKARRRIEARGDPHHEK
jgi:hypothetical protein